MRFRSAMMAVALALFAGATQAAVVTLSSTPTDLNIGDTGLFQQLPCSSAPGCNPTTLAFSLTAPSAVSGLVSPQSVGPLLNFVVSLSQLGGPVLGALTQPNLGESQYFFNFPLLQAGTYDLVLSSGISSSLPMITGFVDVNPAPVPLPAAAWLLLSALGGLGLLARRRTIAPSAA